MRQGIPETRIMVGSPVRSPGSRQGMPIAALTSSPVIGLKRRNLPEGIDLPPIVGVSASASPPREAMAVARLHKAVLLAAQPSSGSITPLVAQSRISERGRPTHRESRSSSLIEGSLRTSLVRSTDRRARISSVDHTAMRRLAEERAAAALRDAGDRARRAAEEKARAKQEISEKRKSEVTAKQQRRAEIYAMNAVLGELSRRKRAREKMGIVRRRKVGQKSLRHLSKQHHHHLSANSLLKSPNQLIMGAEGEWVSHPRKTEIFHRIRRVLLAEKRSSRKEGRQGKRRS